MAYQIEGAPQARDFVSGLGTGIETEIIEVRVFNALGDEVTGVMTISLEGAGAMVTGLRAGSDMAVDGRMFCCAGRAGP